MVAIEPSGFGNDLVAWQGREVLAVYGDYQNVGDGVPDLLRLGRQWRDDLGAGGENCEILHLPEQDIHGNSHMIMMDDNNQDILGRITAWLAGQASHMTVCACARVT